MSRVKIFSGVAVVLFAVGLGFMLWLSLASISQQQFDNRHNDEGTVYCYGPLRGPSGDRSDPQLGRTLEPSGPNPSRVDDTTLCSRLRVERLNWTVLIGLPTAVAGSAAVLAGTSSIRATPAGAPQQRQRQPQREEKTRSGQRARKHEAAEPRESD